MGVRCNEGYDPWIVRLGSAEESDTLMKARTRRPRQDKTNSLIRIRAVPVVSCFVRVFMSVALCPSGLPHDSWSAFVGLSTLRFPEIPEEPDFFVTALSVVSCFVRVFMSVALCPSGLRHDPSSLVREAAKRHARPLQTAILCTAPQSFAPA